MGDVMGIRQRSGIAIVSVLIIYDEFWQRFSLAAKDKRLRVNTSVHVNVAKYSSRQSK